MKIELLIKYNFIEFYKIPNGSVNIIFVDIVILDFCQISTIKNMLRMETEFLEQVIAISTHMRAYSDGTQAFYKLFYNF